MAAVARNRVSAEYGDAVDSAHAHYRRMRSFYTAFQNSAQQERTLGSLCRTDRNCWCVVESAPSLEEEKLLCSVWRKANL